MPPIVRGFAAIRPCDGDRTGVEQDEPHGPGASHGATVTTLRRIGIARSRLTVRFPMRRFAFLLLALFIFSIPFEDQFRLGSIGSISRLAGVATLAAALPGLFVGGRFRLRPPSPFLLATALWLAWLLLSYFWSINGTATLRSIVTYGQLFAMAWLVWELARTEGQRRVLMQAYVLGGYASFALALSAFVSSGGFREVGSVDANYFATFLALGIPFAWRLSVEAPSWILRLINVAYLPMAFAASILAASRGGLLAAVVALVVLVASVPIHRPLLRLGQLALLALLGAGLYTGLLFGFPELQANTERLAEIPQEIQGGTLTNRRLIWTAGYRVFEDRPFVGVGAGNFANAIADVYGVPAAAHNTFLSVMVDGGVIGLALFVLVLGTAVVPTLAASSIGRAAGIALFLALIVGFGPLSIEERKAVWFVLAILASERAIVLAGSSPRAPTALADDPANGPAR